MEAHIPRLRRLLRSEINGLEQADTDLAELEKTMPEGSGAWNKRTREAVNVSLKLFVNQCTDVTDNLSKLCADAEAIIKE